MQGTRKPSIRKVGYSSSGLESLEKTSNYRAPLLLLLSYSSRSGIGKNPPWKHPRYQHIEEDIVELHISLPAESSVNKVTIERLLVSFSGAQYPVSFEIVGLPNEIVMQFAVRESDAEAVTQYLKAYVPEIVVTHGEDLLDLRFDTSAWKDSLIIEFGLDHSFMLPIRTFLV